MVSEEKIFEEDRTMTSTEIIAYWMEALHLSTHSFAQLVGVPESTIRMRIKRSTFTTFDEMCRYAKCLRNKYCH